MVIDAFRDSRGPLVNTDPFSGDMGDPISVVILQTKSKIEHNSAKDRRRFVQVVDSETGFDLRMVVIIFMIGRGSANLSSE